MHWNVFEGNTKYACALRKWKNTRKAAYGHKITIYYFWILGECLETTEIECLARFYVVIIILLSIYIFTHNGTINACAFVTFCKSKNQFQLLYRHGGIAHFQVCLWGLKQFKRNVKFSTRIERKQFNIIKRGNILNLQLLLLLLQLFFHLHHPYLLLRYNFMLKYFSTIHGAKPHYTSYDAYTLPASE